MRALKDLDVAVIAAVLSATCVGVRAQERTRGPSSASTPPGAPGTDRATETIAAAGRLRTKSKATKDNQAIKNKEQTP